MVIREAVTQDLGRILDLLKELDSESYISFEEAKHIWYKMEQYSYYKFFVALDDHKYVVGVFSLLVAENLGHSGSPFAVVGNVVVDKDYRHRGIGTMIMKRAMELAMEKGCYKLTLSSNIKREEAHDLYRKLGFQEHGLSFYIELPR
ncbi:MAG TPA: GNAT family N-acetyltransferase [Aminobacterium sp.]|jgi:GNAT superfamily N-acetyltransferase|uniref:GNAT family N-acetyltransferase n=1 Tax=Aminobacterium TaxID=81466 RepID=UPI0004632AA9|nr:MULTISPECIES: GNAT family N-acetyltransferase [Aminobacterium]HCA41159.1 GNAT family N-acetyltransferase [Aminobacterium sp.]